MTPHCHKQSPQHTRTTNQTALNFSCCAEYQNGLLLEFTYDSRAYRSLVNVRIPPVFPAFTRRISKCLLESASWLSCILCNRYTKAWVAKLFACKRVGGFFNSKWSLHDWRDFCASTSNTSTIKGQLMYYVRISPYFITPYPKSWVEASPLC
jgi:hypothetical protein